MTKYQNKMYFISLVSLPWAVMVVLTVLLRHVNIVRADENTLHTPGERRAQVSEEWGVRARQIRGNLGSRQAWWQLSDAAGAGVNIQRWCRGETEHRTSGPHLHPARSHLPVSDKEPELCIRYRRLHCQHPSLRSRQLEVFNQSVTVTLGSKFILLQIIRSLRLTIHTHGPDTQWSVRYSVSQINPP